VKTGKERKIKTQGDFREKEKKKKTVVEEERRPKEPGSAGKGERRSEGGGQVRSGGGEFEREEPNLSKKGGRAKPLVVERGGIRRSM